MDDARTELLKKIIGELSIVQCSSSELNDVFNSLEERVGLAIDAIDIAIDVAMVREGLRKKIMGSLSENQGLAMALDETILDDVRKRLEDIRDVFRTARSIRDGLDVAAEGISNECDHSRSITK
jgi:hypothetical protein